MLEQEQHRPRLTRRQLLVWTVAAIPVGATVGTYGQLTPEAFVAVLAAGSVVAAMALRRRSGSAAQPAPRAALAWLVWLVAVGVWELITVLHESRLPTLSDLMDPILAPPLVRGLATVLWFFAGIWLLARPSVRDVSR